VSDQNTTYERSTLVNDENYIGLDVHQATIVVAVMDSTGKLVMESILETKAATILQFFAGLRGTLSVRHQPGWGPQNRETYLGRSAGTNEESLCLLSANHRPFEWTSCHDRSP
jgi:hypothetical protein